MNIINTDQAPNPIGPYNQAVEINNLIFLSGQIAINPENGELLPGGIAVQTEQIFANIKAILNKAGLELSDVVRTTCYLTDMSEYTHFNKMYSSFFKTGKEPARSTVEVAYLPKGALIEIDTIAVRPL